MITEARSCIPPHVICSPTLHHHFWTPATNTHLITNSIYTPHHTLSRARNRVHLKHRIHPACLGLMQAKANLRCSLLRAASISESALSLRDQS